MTPAPRPWTADERPRTAEEWLAVQGYSDSRPHSSVAIAQLLEAYARFCHDDLLTALKDIAFIIERGWIPPDDQDFDTWNRVASEYRQSAAYRAVRDAIAKAEAHAEDRTPSVTKAAD